MLRLAVVGDSQRWQPVAIRLREATLETFQSSTESPQSLPAEAILFVELRHRDVSVVESCLSAHKHVLVIAQSWLSSEILEPLAATARAGGVQLAVVNPEHFLPSRKLIRQQLDAGKFGAPGLVRLHRWQSASDAENTAVNLPTPLIRDLEFTLQLMGSAPNLVYAVESPGAPSKDTEPRRTLLVHLGFANGEMAMIDYTNRMPPGDGYESLSLIGSAGAVYVDDQQNMQLVYRGGHPQSLRADEKSLQRAAVAQDFVEGLKANRDFSASIRAWTRAMRIAELVRDSLQGRCSVAAEEL
jgi:predicted dehydrogenase